MPNQVTRLYDGGGGVDDRLQAGATSAALIALGPGTFPDSIYTGDHENIVLWPVNSTAAQTCTLAIWEHTAAIPTLATINRMIGVAWGAGEQTVTTDRVIWGVVTATEYAAKGLANISVTPNLYVSITVGVSLGGVWYLRYSMGHAPLANFYD